MKAFFLLACVAVSGVAFAGQDTYDVASQAATWLNLPDSPRTAAMAGASVALGGDVNTLSVNPAGLSGLGDQQVSLMHDADVQNMTFDHVAYGLGLGKDDGAAVSVDYMNYSTITEYSQVNGTLVPNGSVSPYGLGLDLGYGRALGALSVGATLKLVSENLGIGGADTAAAGDLGVQWNERHPSGWSAGFALRNIGGRLEGADLPTEYQAGVSYYQSLFEGSQGLNFTADATVPTAEANAESLGIGAEYSGNSLWVVRGGYKFVGNGGIGGLSVGGGLKYRGVDIDYAFVNGGVLGNANLISLSAHFQGYSKPKHTAARESQATAVNPSQTSMVTTARTPLVTPVQTPVVTAVQTPVVTPVQTAVVTAVQTPVVTPVQTAVVTPVQTAVVTAVQTPVVTPVQTAVVTVAQTAVVTAVQTPVVTVAQTVVVTAVQPPVVTAVQTPTATVVQTAVVTVVPTPVQTSALDPRILRDSKGAVTGYYFVVNEPFTTYRSDLSDEDKALVGQVYVWLTRNPSCKVSINGYTDSSGNAELNRKLSSARAQEVFRYLRKLGLPTARVVKVKGWGSKHPIAENATAAGRVLNRRVELHILGKIIQ